MNPQRKILPYLALGTGILALGFSALFVRWAAAPGAVTGFYRLGLATIFLAPAFIYRCRSGLPRSRAILLLPVLGGLFSGFDHAIWNSAVAYTTAANATLLGNLAPLWVALVAWLFLRERLSGRFWAGLALTLSGALVVLGSDYLRHPTFSLGDLLAILASLFYAGFYLVTQRGRQHLDTLPYVWIAGASSTVVLLALSLILRQPLTGYPSQTYLAFLGVALVSQIGGYLSLSYALGHLPASIVSPTMIGQPVMTAVLALVLLGEGLHPGQWLGGLGVLAGIYLIHSTN